MKRSARVAYGGAVHCAFGHDDGVQLVDNRVLAGSFTRATAAAAGDNFQTDCGPLGSVAFRFV